MIGRGVMRQHEINSQSVSGAIGIYVLLGIFFIFVFGAIQALSHKAFFVQGHASRPLLLYYSFITMTTVGYGDYTSATQVGKTFAVIEALAGQLYLVDRRRHSRLAVRPGSRDDVTSRRRCRG